MEKRNEVKVNDSKKGTMTIRRGDKSIELSPEITQQICTEMVTLGTQLVSETGKITIEYFKVQADMYYAQLNTYIKNEVVKSDERKMILLKIEDLIDDYINLINSTDDVDKREVLKETYQNAMNMQANLYIQALKVDSETGMPNRPNLLSIIIRKFSRSKN